MVRRRGSLSCEFCLVARGNLVTLPVPAPAPAPNSKLVDDGDYHHPVGDDVVAESDPDEWGRSTTPLPRYPNSFGRVDVHTEPPLPVFGTAESGLQNCFGEVRACMCVGLLLSDSKHTYVYLLAVAFLSPCDTLKHTTCCLLYTSPSPRDRG